MAKMAMAFGRSEDLHFDENEEGFDAYLEMLEQFFVANGLIYDDDKVKGVFLTVVGRKNHTLLMDLCVRVKLSVKKLSEPIEEVSCYLQVWGIRRFSQRQICVRS